MLHVDHYAFELHHHGVRRRRGERGHARCLLAAAQRSSGDGVLDARVGREEEGGGRGVS